MAEEEDADSGDRLLAESFGRCVKRHREAAGMTQTELSARSGLRMPYIWRIENGQTMANLRTIGRISRALDVPVHVLCAGVDTSGLSLENRGYTQRQPPRDASPQKA